MSLKIGQEVVEAKLGNSDITLNNLVPVNLYENTSGANNTITLSDSSANYKYIEIFFRNTDDIYNYVKVFSPNGKKVNLTSDTSYGTELYSKNKTILISDTSISNVLSNSWYANGSSVSTSNTNDIYIIKIIGYK